MIYKIVIGGCRYYNNYTAFTKIVDICLSKIKNEKEIVILSGHCSGVDKMAERYAEENRYKLEVYPAQWEKYGKSAGPKRNEIMVKNSNAVIAFWDYKSRGTKNLITLSKKYSKPIRIIDINQKGML